MDIEKGRLKQLLTEYITDTISKADLNELLDYVSLNEDEAELDAFMEEMFDGMDVDQPAPLSTGELYKRIIKHPQFKEEVVRRNTKVRWWVASAAAIILLGVGTLLYNEISIMSSTPHAEVTLVIETQQSSEKGRSAILRLADGREINLDDAKSGVLVKQNNMQITLKGTELHYEGGELFDKNGNILMNTISTPRGRQYQVVLPDGSKIWLNTATTLTYPVRFSADQRLVEVSGEAYFEVQKAEDWPFVVKTTNQQVEVLGTHFNVSAYDDDGEITKTTLVEGSVRVSLVSKETDILVNSSILAPGQQSTTIKNSDKIKIRSVDTEEVVSWKRNLFVFTNEEVGEVMKKVSRWYDVDVEYEDGMGGKRIGGTIPRFESIEKLMEALEATGLLHYRMEGGKVIIMK